MVLVPCPACGKTLMVPPELLGGVVRCSACQGVVQTKAPEPAVPPTPPTPPPVPRTTARPSGKKPVATLPQLELEAAPAETPTEKPPPVRPAPRKPAGRDADVPVLTDADVVEETPTVLLAEAAEPEPVSKLLEKKAAARRAAEPARREPARRPEPQPADPFAFDEPAAGTPPADPLAFDDDTSGGKKAIIGGAAKLRALTQAAAGWLVLAATVGLVGALVLLGISSARASSAVPSQYQHLLLAGFLLRAALYLVPAGAFAAVWIVAARCLAAQKHRVMVQVAAVLALVHAGVVLLGCGVGWPALALLGALSTGADVDVAFLAGNVLYVWLYGACSLVAGLRGLAAINTPAVREAFDANRDRTADAQMRRSDLQEERDAEQERSSRRRRRDD